MEFLYHVNKDTKEIMKDIEIATTNLERRLDALGRMLVKHVKLNPTDKTS